MEDKIVKFTLELYYEKEDDKSFAEEEKFKLLKLVSQLAPHIHLEVLILAATNPLEEGTEGTSEYMPYHLPNYVGNQSLLITNKKLVAKGEGYICQGKTNNGKPGCVVKSELESKKNKSSYCIVHEWFHTLCGQKINGRILCDPDCLDPRFNSERARLEAQDWHDWYKYMLRWEP